jgi:hypothetical protein
VGQHQWPFEEQALALSIEAVFIDIMAYGNTLGHRGWLRRIASEAGCQSEHHIC